MDGTSLPAPQSVPVGNTQYPLAPLCDRWNRSLDAAEKTKYEDFDQWANEAMNFFDGPANYMWQEVKKQSNDSSGFLEDGASLPKFQMSVNRLFEAVSLFGPSLYHQNPTIAVTPRTLPDVSIQTYFADDEQALELIDMIPWMEQGVMEDEATVEMAQQVQDEYEQVSSLAERRRVVDGDHARILEAISNYTQQEGSKKDEARTAITEAIITGLGLLEIKMEQPPGGGPKMARSRYRTNKDLLVDPDAKYWRDVTWIALRSLEPANKVEEKFNLRPGTLKGHYARRSEESRGQGNSLRHGNNQMAGQTHDLVEYWEIYSKNGAGQHLKVGEKDTKIKGLEGLGDFVYLAICKKCPFPLNLSPQVLQAGPEVMLDAASWEVPYWDDYAADGGWPIVRLSFYDKPGKVWPISMVKPCIGELRFINWCMSFLADKVAAGSKIYVAAMKEAAENIRGQLASGSGPFSVIELEKIFGKQNINEIISFLQAPDVNTDIWRMVAEVAESVDKRLGLTELMYGLSGRQMRSAAEAQYRQSNINIRPDDMASRVEDWLSLSATREIQAIRFLGEFEDVEPVIGSVAAQVFATQILTQDVSRITRDFTYRVTAGTARKPNKDTQIAQLTDLGQYLLPVIQPMAQIGVVGPYNAYVTNMARAMDMDATPYLLGEEESQQLSMMNAPPPGPAPQGGGSEDGQA